jgi:DNA polymerase-3 subunit epsilon
MPYIDALRATAEVVLQPTAPAPAAHPEETELVLRWLETPGTRLVTVEGEWTCPVGGAGGAKAQLDPISRQWGDVAGPWGEVPNAKPLERPPGALRPVH